MPREAACTAHSDEGSSAGGSMWAGRGQGRLRDAVTAAAQAKKTMMTMDRPEEYPRVPMFRSDTSGTMTTSTTAVISAARFAHSGSSAALSAMPAASRTRVGSRSPRMTRYDVIADAFCIRIAAVVIPRPHLPNARVPSSSYDVKPVVSQQQSSSHTPYAATLAISNRLTTKTATPLCRIA